MTHTHRNTVRESKGKKVNIDTIKKYQYIDIVYHSRNGSSMLQFINKFMKHRLFHNIRFLGVCHCRNAAIRIFHIIQ